MSISFVMRLRNSLSSFPNMLHNQLLYSFYSGGKLTIRMIHVHIVVKSDTQVRYVTNSPFSFSPKLWHKHSYRQIPRSFLSSHFPSPYHLAPLLFPLLRSNPILYFTRTMHAHDASHRAAPTRMCALCMWVGHGMTTVESNMKGSIIYTWLVKTLHSIFLSLVLVLPS